VIGVLGFSVCSLPVVGGQDPRDSGGLSGGDDPRL
jgi:hypothetical protein